MNLFATLLINDWKRKFKNFFKPDKCNCKVCASAQNAKKNLKKFT